MTVASTPRGTVLTSKTVHDPYVQPSGFLEYAQHNNSKIYEQYSSSDATDMLRNPCAHSMLLFPDTPSPECLAKRRAATFMSVAHRLQAPSLYLYRQT